MTDYQQKTWLDSIIEEHKNLKEENHNIKEEIKKISEENEKLKSRIMEMNYLEYRKSLNLT